MLPCVYVHTVRSYVCISVYHHPLIYGWLSLYTTVPPPLTECVCVCVWVWVCELVAIPHWAVEPGDLSAPCLSDTRASHVAPGQLLSKPTIHYQPWLLRVCVGMCVRERDDGWICWNYSLINCLCVCAFVCGVHSTCTLGAVLQDLARNIGYFATVCVQKMLWGGVCVCVCVCVCVWAWWEEAVNLNTLCWTESLAVNQQYSNSTACMCAAVHAGWERADPAFVYIQMKGSSLCWGVLSFLKSCCWMLFSL